MTMDPLTDIREGLPVYTVDGEEIGTVKAVVGDSFHVDAPMRPDFWLKRVDVQAFNTERVTLAFPKERLGDHKVDGPDVDRAVTRS